MCDQGLHVAEQREREQQQQYLRIFASVSQVLLLLRLPVFASLVFRYLWLGGCSLPFPFPFRACVCFVFASTCLADAAAEAPTDRRFPCSVGRRRLSLPLLLCCVFACACVQSNPVAASSSSPPTFCCRFWDHRRRNTSGTKTVDKTPIAFLRS